MKTLIINVFILVSFILSYNVNAADTSKNTVKYLECITEQLEMIEENADGYSPKQIAEQVKELGTYCTHLEGK